jgi:hypothetical protein
VLHLLLIVPIEGGERAGGGVGGARRLVACGFSEQRMGMEVGDGADMRGQVLSRWKRGRGELGQRS